VKRIAAILFAAAALPFAVQAQNQVQKQAQTQPQQPQTVRPGNVANAADPAVKAATDAAGKAAQAWLALDDANSWDACWDALAPAVKGQIGKDAFAESLRTVRNELGAVTARHPHSVTFTHKMPNAPDGDYVVLQYDTDFANGSALETVIPMRMPDGSWRVSGYFVQ
jgi:hypothetical protein